MVKNHTGVYWIETVGNKGDQDFKVLDCLHVQRNENNTLFITRSQFDPKKDKYLPDETYILKKTTERKISNICSKMYELQKEIRELGK